MVQGMGSIGDVDYQNDMGNWPERIVEQAEALKRHLQQIYSLVGQHSELSQNSSHYARSNQSN